jgi:amino acid adenylation domain-containing protein
METNRESILKRILTNLDNDPDRILIQTPSASITSREFYASAANIAAYINTNLSREQLVGIYYGDDLETYCFLFAVYLTGKTYVPLNPDNPLDRNEDIIRSADVLTVFIAGNDAKGLDSLAKVVFINDAVKSIGNADLTITPVDSSEYSYILFTSGSTGHPKGVPITWENVSAFVDSFFAKGLQLTKDDVFLQMFDFSFDVSVAMFITPLVAGGTIYSVCNAENKYVKIGAAVQKNLVTVLCMVPSVLVLLEPYFHQLKNSHIKYCFLTAEATTVGLLEKWSKCIPEAVVYNLYGPTEGTVWVFYHEVGKTGILKEYNGMLAIGNPYKNVDYIILDDDDHPVALRGKGELLISGPQITRGYLNNPEKNALSFVSLNNERSGVVRYYRTGDICFQDEQGDVYYCGRKDHQVKIQGHRVELSEIENVIRINSKITDVAAVFFKDKNALGRIHLYVGADQHAEADIISLLEDKLPAYMIPERVIVMATLPINNSSKVDRRRLQQLSAEGHTI